MSAGPRRIVMGHDAAGRSVVLAVAPDGAIGSLELFDQVPG